MADQPPPYPVPPSDSVVFSQFDGLKNVVARERLKTSELEVATNVDIDDAGQIRRRRGFRQVSSGKWHSLYSDATGLKLGVKDNVLGIIGTNYTFDPLLPNVGPEHLSYVRVADTVYFSSAATSGKILNRQVLSWGQQGGSGTWLSPVVNPTTSLGQVKGKLLGRPPLATELTYWNGRIYLAQDTTLWATELYLYDYVDKTRTFFQFEDEITMLAAVTDGVYVGTKSAQYFLSYERGFGSIENLKRVPLASYGVIAGSAVSVPAELIKPQISGQEQASPTKNAIMYLSETGIVAGFDSGVTYNLTQADYTLPTIDRAATMFRRQDGINQFVASADSGGSPSTGNARIGDYVSAEVRRFVPPQRTPIVVTVNENVSLGGGS